MLTSCQVTYVLLEFAAKAVLADVRRLIPEFEHRDNDEREEIIRRWAVIIGEKMQVDPSVYRRKDDSALREQVRKELGLS